MSMEYFDHVGRKDVSNVYYELLWSDLYIYFSSLYLVFTYRKRDLKTEKSPYLFLDCDKDIVVFAIQSLG